MKDRVTYLAQHVYPLLFERLDQAFPEFGWRRTSTGWVATNREFTKSRLRARPDRVICNEPFGFLVHGAAPQTWLAYVNGGTRPTGRDFIAAVRVLEARAGVEGVEEREPRVRAAHARPARLTPEGAEALIEATRPPLASPAGESAREHLKARGLGNATVAGFGLYTSWPEIAPQLAPARRTELHSVLTRAARDRFWSGRVLIPWRDALGQIASFVGYQVAGEGPRYLYAAGPHPPLFGLDRAAASARPIENLILVEGIFDALRLHEEGIESCASLGGTAVSPRVIERLESLRVLSVTLALDRDEPGVAATVAALEAFRGAGSRISVDVLDAARLRDCKDPDELVQRYGRDAFLEALERRIAGSVLLAGRILSKDDVEVNGDAQAAHLDEAAKLYATIPDTTRGHLERGELLDFTARRTGIAEPVLRARFDAVLRDERARGLATDLRSTLQRATAELRDTTDPERVAATLHTRLGDLLRTGSR